LSAPGEKKLTVSLALTCTSKHLRVSRLMHPPQTLHQHVREIIKNLKKGEGERKRAWRIK
jgi:hypothetical protein